MYCLNGNLLPGDVVLLRGPTLSSRFIAVAGRGRVTTRFSHAAIYMGNGSFLEATPPGVQRLSALRVRVVERRNMEVLRLCTGNKAEDLRRSAEAARIAAGFQAHPYDLVAAILSPLGGALKRRREFVFCSSLIAISYRRAGETLLGVSDHRVTPNRLRDSTKLGTVSEATVVECDPTDGLPGLDTGDGSRPIASYSRRMVVVLERGNELLMQHGLSRVEGLNELYMMLALRAPSTAVQEIDLELVQVIKDVDLNEFIAHATQLTGGTSLFTNARALLETPGLTPEEARKELEAVSGLLNSKISVLREYREERDRLQMLEFTSRLQTFKALADFYRLLCIEYEKYVVSIDAACRELDRYLKP